MFTQFIKRNNILLVFSALYLLAVALVLMEMDKQYYQNAKKSIISENSQYYSPPQLDEKYQEIETLTVQAMRRNDPALMSQLIRKIDEVLAGQNIVFRIAIRPAVERSAQAGHEGMPRVNEDYLVNISREAKRRASNNFANSLFLRDFTGQIGRPIMNGSGGKELARLYVFYTTPLHDAEIEELTTRYRWYAVFTVLILSLLASAVMRSLLFPMRNVINSIELSTTDRAIFIPRSHSRLENLYNRMALDAVIAHLQARLRDEITLHPQMTSWEIIGFICQAFREHVGMPLVACLELVAADFGALRPTGQRIMVGQADWVLSEDELVKQLIELLPRDGRREVRFTLPDAQSPVEGALKLSLDPERSGLRYLFVLTLNRHTSETAYVSLPHVLHELTDLVEAGLQSLSLRNQLVVQERGRANISLSRNLGHDLTNIIATSKLELMALDRLVGGGNVPEDERRRTILSESLHGLLRSVKFMQETVNLYRAYAFLQHPILDTQDGNQLVAETLDLFGLSISAKVALLRELDAAAPRCVVDQRLVKLALFNLFANALEAIRKNEADSSARGWIRVVTSLSEAGGLRIAVEDSGTGIINSAGQPAESHEIEKIFELGYTSRRASANQGEGLGLNWVRTIVQDLHGGTIIAENIPGGGARFVLTFPSMLPAIDESPDAATTPSFGDFSLD